MACMVSTSFFAPIKRQLRQLCAPATFRLLSQKRTKILTGDLKKHGRLSVKRGPFQPTDEISPVRRRIAVVVSWYFGRRTLLS